jgi:hypothetical protein
VVGKTAIVGISV